MPELRRVIDELKEMKGTSPWTRTVIVDSGGKGDFTSIKAACDYVATQSPASATRWLIKVFSGNYTESPFSIPAYTTLSGISGFTAGISSSGFLSVIYLASGSLLSGTFITQQSSSAIENFYIICNFGSTVVNGGTNVISGGKIANCYIGNAGSKLTGYDHSVIYGSVAVYNCYIQPASLSTSVGIYATGSTTVAYCTLYPYLSLSKGYKQTGGDNVIFFTRFGTGAGAFFGLDIEVAGGTLTVNNTPYKTSSGTINHIDRWYPSLAAIREAVAATDTPLILKGAAAQTANLTEWKDSADNVLASMDKDGKISAAGFSAGASVGVSGTFTTVDGKTVTVTNGIITSIV